MAPIHLERLIEICCSTDVRSCPHVMKSTGTCTPLKELEEWGLIKRDTSTMPKDYEATGWVVTDRGKVHLDNLCSITFPSRQWVAANRS